jgi:hypothetical protein
LGFDAMQQKGATEETKQHLSAIMRARWADPIERKKLSESIKKSPKCPTCGETDVAKFYLDKDGRRTTKTCRECHKKACKQRWHARDWLDRWASRNYKYGVTKEYLIELYQEQDGKCKICSEVPSTQRGLHVDHCHESGKVRGLLCHGCNVALGSFKDDPDLLTKAIEYLRSK